MRLEQAPEPVRHTGHRGDISDPEKPGIKGAIAKAQEAGFGLETELAEPDGDLVAAAKNLLVEIGVI